MTIPLNEQDRQAQIDAAWDEHLQWRPQHSRWRTQSLRVRLAEAQNWRCCWCHQPMALERKRPDSATFEHIVPRCMGGPDRIENVVIACNDCNNRRPADRVELFRIAAMLREAASV